MSPVSFRSAGTASIKCRPFHLLPEHSSIMKRTFHFLKKKNKLQACRPRSGSSIEAVPPHLQLALLFAEANLVFPNARHNDVTTFGVLTSSTHCDCKRTQSGQRFKHSVWSIPRNRSSCRFFYPCQRLSNGASHARFSKSLPPTLDGVRLLTEGRSSRFSVIAPTLSAWRDNVDYHLMTNGCALT